MSDENGSKPAQNGEVKIMHVPTRFAALASRPNGMSRDEALDRADTFIENIEPKYLEWVERDLAKLTEVVDFIHKAKSMSKEDYQSAYRKSNHIRDLGGTFSYDLITVVADSMSELLFRLGEAERYDQAALVAHMNALCLVCSSQFKGVKPDAVGDLIGSLQKLVAKYSDPDAELKEAEQRRREEWEKLKAQKEDG